jgi:hypothetical protein
MKIINFESHFKIFPVFFTYLFILFFEGCASSNQQLSWYSTTSNPKWLDGPKRFSPLKKYVHPFFDFSPDVSPQEKTLNFIPLTFNGDREHFDLDLVSGQIYHKGSFCAKNDLLNESLPVPAEIPFTLGIIPRYMVNIGKGFFQKIIVVGKGNYFRLFPSTNISSDQLTNQDLYAHKVRIIGGVVEEFCPKFPCRLNSKERAPFTHVIPIAVDLYDPQLFNVNNLKDLNVILPLEKIILFWQNAFNGSYFNNKVKSHINIVKEISDEETFKKLSEQAIKFKPHDLNLVRKNCYKLYDYFWEKILKEKTLNLDGKDQALDKNFPKRFIHFHENFGKKFFTCSQMVPYSSLEENPQRHWSMVSIVGFYKSLDLGELYNCSENKWSSSSGDLITSTFHQKSLKELKSCTSEQFSNLFKTLTLNFENLKRYREPYYRYVEYDSNPNGSHQKVFSWVYENNLRIFCSSKEDSEKIHQERLMKIIFSQDPRENSLKLN